MHLVVRRDGRLNLADLKPPASRASAQPVKSKPMRLYLDRLAVLGGSVIYEDRSHPTPFRGELDSIAFDLRDLRTVGAAPSRYALQFATVHGGRFHGTGAMALDPFASHGTFAVTGLPVRTLWSYVRDQLRFEVASGTIALDGAYALGSAGPSGGVTVDLSDVKVSDLGLRPLAASSDAVHLGVLDARGTHVDLEHRSLSIGSIDLKGGTLHAALEKDGRIDLAALMSGPSSTSDASGSAQPASGKAQPTSGTASARWSVSAPSVSLEGLKLVAEDREVAPAATVTLDDVALHVRDFRSPGDAPLKISVAAKVDRTGRLAIDGTYALDSGAASAHVALDRIDLTPLQPFLAARSALALRSGQLTTKLDVRRSAQGNLSATGTTQIANLRTVDERLGRDFVKWKRLTLEDMTYRSQPDSLAIRRIVAVAPYARVTVTPQRKLSLFQAFTPAHGALPASQSGAAAQGAPRTAPAAAATAASDEAASSRHAMSVSVGRIDVKNGSAHYTDLWIVPHFF
ncbi:MAG: DUF748 domain-containing protein, partial [Steroidobacteraceae bacterium]